MQCLGCANSTLAKRRYVLFEISYNRIPLPSVKKEDILYIMKKLGALMKEKREAMGLSLRDASRFSGVSHTHIRDIEDGRSIPLFVMVMKCVY
jgi:predicted transcriptional regulator